MSRSSNLDNVAPDDIIVTPKPKSINPTKTTISPTPPSSSVNSAYRQKINEILGHTKHPFSAFLAHPKVFSFKEKDDQEVILLVLRQHWFTNVGWIVIAVLMALAPLLLRFIPLLASFPLNYQFISVLFWYLITITFIFERFLSWYFNVYIITDERVVDIDFNNLLDKKFSEAKISMIQDITSRVSGLSQTILNYGTVYIQTASEVPEIQFEKVPNPEKVILVLQQLRQEEEQEALEGRVR